MSSPCQDIVEDIEDLILHDIAPKKKFTSSRNFASIEKRTKKLPELEIYSSIIPGTHTVYIKTWGCTHNSSDSEYMAGQLVSHGYIITEDKYVADLWLLNSCTVKSPAEDHFRNEIAAGKKFGKHIVVAGCVPQGAPKTNFIKNLSIIGVHQIDRVIEVVEETLKGNTVKFLHPKKSGGKKIGGASLLLPKIRKNPLIEIIAVNTGCLNKCTYCKTKHARGELGSYKIDEIIERTKQAFEEGVKELWLTSEDIGTYGKDIGTNLPELLWKVIEVVPDGCRMRIGMTNPPYILEYLEEMSKIFQHPKVYSFLHIPVQSGSNQVLMDMKREYTRHDFEYIVNFLKARIPEMNIATDIICGFPTETEEDFKDTMDLCRKYKFSSLFINQFFSRPGTPAAKMVQNSAKEIKKRTKTISEFFQSYEPYGHEIGQVQNVLVTELAHDRNHYVAHNHSYEQVLIPMKKEYMGKIIRVRIISASKYSMKGEPLNEDFRMDLKPNFKQELISKMLHGVQLFGIHTFIFIVISVAIIIRLFFKCLRA